MRNFRRIRDFLGLRQSDVEHGTGIPVYKLSAAEAGKITLSLLEQGLLNDFYLARLRWIVSLEGESSFESSQALVVN